MITHSFNETDICQNDTHLTVGLIGEPQMVPFLIRVSPGSMRTTNRTDNGAWREPERVGFFFSQHNERT